jgi:hypothetical protein
LQGLVFVFVADSARLALDLSAAGHVGIAARINVPAGTIAASLSLSVDTLVKRRSMIKMNEPTAQIKVALRIPGQWAHPKELIERLPADCRLTPESLFLPDGTEVEFGAGPADGQFAGIFRSSCRQPPTEEELYVRGDRCSKDPGLD